MESQNYNEIFVSEKNSSNINSIRAFNSGTTRNINTSISSLLNKKCDVESTGNKSCEGSTLSFLIKNYVNQRRK